MLELTMEHIRPRRDLDEHGMARRQSDSQLTEEAHAWNMEDLKQAIARLRKETQKDFVEVEVCSVQTDVDCGNLQDLEHQLGEVHVENSRLRSAWSSSQVEIDELKRMLRIRQVEADAREDRLRATEKENDELVRQIRSQNGALHIAGDQVPPFLPS